MNNPITDSMSQLPVDLFIQQITYLPFHQVTALCTSNTKFHNYCMNPDYSNRWKSLIDNTFSQIDNYSELLKEIQNELNLEGKYNYLVYVGLIKNLDPLTQLMIYYRQNDMQSFNSDKFTQEQRFLALLLLNRKREELMKYLPEAKQDSRFDRAGNEFLEFINVLDTGDVSDDYIRKSGYMVNDETKEMFRRMILGSFLHKMVRSGNMKGLLLMVEKGADIYGSGPLFVFTAAEKGYLPVVKYLVENKVRYGQDPLTFARINGHTAVVEYLESKLNK